MSFPQVISYWFLLRLQAVLKMNGQGRSTFYGQMANGLWPQPVSLGARAVAWPVGEIAAVVASRVAGQSDEEIRSLVNQLEAVRKTAPGLIAQTCVLASEAGAEAACQPEGSVAAEIQTLTMGPKKARKSAA